MVGLYGFAVKDNYAYIANSKHSLSIIDLTSSDNLSVAANYSDTDYYIAEDLVISSDYLYAAGGFYGLQRYCQSSCQH
ncbi:MAG: hypothetical protein ACLFUI_09720 [Halanaerobiales bacterium]